MTQKSPGHNEAFRKAIDSAYRILSIRSRSEEELRQKLRQKGFQDSIVNEIISSLKEKGYVNDADFALNFSRYLLRTRHYGLIRIAEELRKKGVPPGNVRDAVHVLRREIDEREMVVASLEGKLRGNDISRMDEKWKKRIVQYLYRKGFPLDTIYEVLKSRKWNGVNDDREGD